MDIIKEYLVGLGFNVDNQSYNNFNQALGNADKLVKGFAARISPELGAAMTSIYALVESLKHITIGLAQADLQNQIFAHRMWTSTENAVAYKNSLSALGASMEDLYYSPELLQRFYALRSQSFEMSPPKEYAQMMKQWRDIMFEFSRFKLEITYALQWIGYYFYKYMEGPIQTLKANLHNLNDWLTKSMPEWTKNVAMFASWIAKLVLAGAKATEVLFNLFNQLPSKTKIAIGAFTALFAVITSGPIGWIIAGLTMILGLLDDYFTYASGGKSLFGPLWESLGKNGMFKGMAGGLQDMAKGFGDLLDSLARLAEAILGVFNNFAKLLGYQNAIQMFGDILTKSFDAAAKILEGMAGAIDTISKLIGIISTPPQGISADDYFKNYANNNFAPKSAAEGGAAITINQNNVISGADSKNIAKAMETPNNNLVRSIHIRGLSYGGGK